MAAGKMKMSPMRIGVCVTLDQPVAPVEGLDFLEGLVPDVLCPLEPREVFARRESLVKALAYPMEAVNRLFPPQIKTTGPQIDQRALDEYMGVVCQRAARIGAKVVVFGAGPSRRVPEGFERQRAFQQLVDHLKRWAPMARDAEIVIAIEPLNRHESNIINSVAEAAQLARSVDHPNIRILADTFHMGREGEGTEGITSAGAGLLCHVHCADPVERAPLGLGPSDHRPYFAALKRIDYTGRVCIEAVWRDFPAQLAAAVAGLRDQIETA